MFIGAGKQPLGSNQTNIINYLLLGGGGAGTVGLNGGNALNGANGGDGFRSDIAGYANNYGGGGGGGGGAPQYNGATGLGVGYGDGGTGAAQGYGAGGAGGVGYVVLSIPYPYYTAKITGIYTLPYHMNGNVIIRFYGHGTYTA